MLRIATLLTWLCSLCMGFIFLANYSTTPGEFTQTCSHWPQDSKLLFQPGKSNILVFLHPQCPCSTATMRQLEKLGIQDDSISLTLVFLVPSKENGETWSNTRIASWPIHGAKRIADHNGEEAKRFQVSTSGHVLVFNSAGLLTFSGGITAGRGHEGLSPSYQEFHKQLHGEPSEKLQSFEVYGCPLDQPETGE